NHGSTNHRRLNAAAVERARSKHRRFCRLSGSVRWLDRHLLGRGVQTTVVRRTVVRRPVTHARHTRDRDQRPRGSGDGNGSHENIAVMTREGRHSDRGFTIIEMLVATALIVTVMGSIFTLINPARATFQAQGEVADMHQRLRAALDMLAGDLRAADGVRPYRVGGTRDDAAAGIYYRPDTISVLGVPSSALSADAQATRTYYLKSDARASVFELMQFDGRLTDLPVIEHVVALAFDYFADPEADGAA